MRRYPPKWEALARAFVGVKTNPSSGRQAKHYLCAMCKEEFVASKVQVDHKKPIGSCETWDEFIDSLFCDVSNLQILCLSCHKEKTKKERKKK